MRTLIIFAILFGLPLMAQVDMSEKEKIEQQRETNRKEDALRDSAVKPNAPSSVPAPVKVNIDPSAHFEVDHSAFGYSVLTESENPLTGIKFSGAFTAGFYQEQKKDKMYRIIAGVELPIDLDMGSGRFVPFAGGGFQIGSKSGIYINAGLDIRLTQWFKIQAGGNYVIGNDPSAILGAALTW